MTKSSGFTQHIWVDMLEAQTGIEPMSTVLQTPPYMTKGSGFTQHIGVDMLEAQTGIEPMSTVLQTAA